MKAAGSIMAPPAVAFESFIWRKPLPLWLGTASFIQVLLIATEPMDCDKYRRQRR